ncbi:DEAD/DEAH box helicase [Hydrogenovibrio marinus]|uniref:ATP-dependent RNA helicase DeaD n=1 Tax=Hydrogenovibrio marinus TaxID=28885 RepID=A0A067A0W4_HYDMR|nr:DEAD/DEAH box helicase [Hydrogenovibrio marinus]KDN96236.1 RNA helicase [Hydrogenovibrio marinus]BBN60584.1 ATP-dependent RNA helicase DeaD [Hydrogenovibrio marinus]
MNTDIKFEDLGLATPILKTLSEIGYETPSPIQAQAIPAILKGGDILGMAQTGTGKTAAFALPILSKINLKQKDPQVLVLAPTRELAIQVAEAFQTFSRNIKDLHVLPIYGGSEYSGQIRALKRGVHVVVGTPGRVMDHIKKGTLKLDGITNMVLDEADEMLRMGFIDDVEWILKHTPASRQIALFSATMPKEIHRIANTYLNNPSEVIIKQKTSTASTIDQKYWLVSGLHKLDALTRILEAEEFDGIIIFVRTKTATVELAEKLEARGYAAAALNGDIAQNQRERIVDQLKAGKLDILIATDVVARGLDVERISHVINYDIPYDNESYVHRIGRTGRAGRSGTAILFVAPRERRLLRSIEQTTNKKITPMELPSTKDINQNRILRFKDKVVNAVQEGDLKLYQEMIESIESEHNIPAVEIAAGLAKILQGDVPFFLDDKPIKQAQFDDRPERGGRDSRNDRGGRDSRNDRGANKGRNRQAEPNEGMERFRIEVGRNHGVKPGNIIGCIANEAGLDGEYIQKLVIEDNYSLVDLPDQMPKDVFNDLKNAWVCGRQLSIAKVKDAGAPKRRLKNKAKRPSGPRSKS